ncbi:MAG: hypothetical protein HY269_05745 [Deltaproteobacteria bacterium]|nr:hypothetical protein [Deltaproteobacteria bacterium]
MVMGRTMVAVMMMMFTATAGFAVTIKDSQRIKAPDGHTIAIVVACDACGPGKPATAKAPCVPGAKAGFWDGEPCGDCLMDSNFGARVGHPFDLHLRGSLKDANGKPLDNQFVKLIQPNGWTFTTRTSAEGLFNVVLGATLDRGNNPPLAVDLGAFTVTRKEGKEGAFTLYMLPEQFKPCEPPKHKKKK